jgi:uncharacterized cupredoxin-like copper-binding protein
MIRFFVLTGLVGGALVAYLTTAAVGPINQMPPPESLLTKFREEGFLPASPNLGEDETAEEIGVFEVPATDEVHLEEAQAAFDKMMGGMDMSGMNMGNADSGTMNMADGGRTGSTSMDMGTTKGETMNMANGGAGSQSGSMDMGATSGETMNMAEVSNANNENMNMQAPQGDGMNMADGGAATDGSGTNMANGGDSPQGGMNMAAEDGENMTMSEGGNATMDMNAADGTTMDMTASTGMNMAGNATMDMGEGGLLVTEEGDYDREIVLTMSEWKFSDMNIKVAPGERIKFTVKNGGQIPHEFMFMSPPLMQAVTYRGIRADWSLFEHEALFEKALVLPGGEFSFVLKVTQPGSWMFMCMLPYHMQMGMMGQMATEGMAMDM